MNSLDEGDDILKIPLNHINATIDYPEIVYCVVFDSDFYVKNDLTKLIDNYVTFGKIRKYGTEHKFFPVLYDVNDAENVAKRLIDTAVQQGSIGNKKYPVFGSVILRLQLTGVNSVETNVESDKVDYTKLENEIKPNIDLINYTIKSHKRGVLTTSGLSKASVLNAKYITKLDVQLNIGFSLLNRIPELSSIDIKILKKLYDNQDFQTLTDEQKGGDIYKQLYMDEKQQYLLLKKMHNELKQGSITKDQIYEQLYKLKKHEYLKLKNNMKYKE